jgi:hypothetical protein
MDSCLRGNDMGKGVSISTAEPAHGAPQNPHLTVEIATGLAYQQMQVHPRALQHRQLAVQPFGGEPVDFLASGFERHG